MLDERRNRVLAAIAVAAATATAAGAGRHANAIGAIALAGSQARPHNGAIVSPGAVAAGTRILSAPLGAGGQRILARGSFDSLAPTPSPDGASIAFLRAGSDQGTNGYSLWMMRRDGGGKVNLAVGRVTSAPTWAPDGQRLAFAGPGARSIRTARSDGSDVREIVSATTSEVRTPVWSPDGSWIAYSASAEELWAVRPDGTDGHLIARAARASFPIAPPEPNFSWSPDGGRLVYVGVLPTPYANVTDLLTATVDGRSIARLTEGVGGDLPQWSPDGTRIAFGTSGPILVVPADGSAAPREVTRGYAASWSPDGAQLAVIRGGQVYVARADGSGSRRVSRGEGTFLHIRSRARWTSDGRQVVFVRNPQSFGSELFTFSASGQTRRRLTHNRVVEAQPAYSPNGQKVAFAGVPADGRSWAREIYVMDADGRHLRRLTRNPADDLSPVWSPDGRRVAFVRHSPSRASLYVLPLGGGGGKALRRIPRWQTNLSWAPGRWIAVDGTTLISPSGHSMRAGTRPAPYEEDQDPDWSPDGRLAFVRVATPCGGERCATSTLLVTKAGSDRVRRVGRGLASPVWSPDGRWIAALDTQYGSLVAIRPDGSHRHVLARRIGDTFDWRPRR